LEDRLLPRAVGAVGHEAAVVTGDGPHPLAELERSPRVGAASVVPRVCSEGSAELSCAMVAIWD
jgi:hypothetical protein